jgi:uncharacterized membrane protein
MTENNIQTLIGFAFMLGVFYIVYNFIYKVYTSSDKVETVNKVKVIEPDKTIWDKLKIVGIVVSAIAALLYAVVKVVELFIGKK